MAAKKMFVETEDIKRIPIDGIYFADKQGRIYSKTGRELNCSVSSKGYKQLFSWQNGKFDRSYSVNRLIYLTFNGEILEGNDIDHINRIKLDNRLENLRQLSRSENCKNSDRSDNKKVIIRCKRGSDEYKNLISSRLKEVWASGKYANRKKRTKRI